MEKELQTIETKQIIERRQAGGRFVVSLPIKVEWHDSDSGHRVVEDGLTENIGPDGTLIHLPRRLPRVGSQVELSVFFTEGDSQIAQTTAEVLRLERNAAHPQAALRVLDEHEIWLQNVYENDEIRLAAVGTPDEYDD
jgi:hypothetical protein